MEYEIDEDFKNKNPSYHLLVFIPSLAMAILSFILLKDGVGNLLFSFYVVSLLYKVVVVAIQMGAYKKNVKKEIEEKTSSYSRMRSPYHKQLIFISFMLFMVCFLMVFAIIKLIDVFAFYIGVISLSIIVSFLKDSFDGLVSIYDAHSTVATSIKN